MSAIITGKVFWTDYSGVVYYNKKKEARPVKPSTSKGVMLAIADNADDFGENSWQSFETIATKASIERRSAIRVVRALIDAGHLKIAGRTRYGTNNFTIILDKLGDPPKARAKVGRPKISDPETPIIGQATKISDPEAEIGDPGAENSDPQSPYPSLNPPKPIIKRSLSEKTKRAVKNNPAWAIAAGEEYEGDPHLVALENIRQEWETRMRQSPNWALPGWNDFPAWLLEKHEQGQTVQRFARWFRFDKFRKDGIGMWTPGGDKYGRFSFKSVWLQAFEDPKPVEQAQPKQRELTPFEMATQNVDAF